MRSRNDQDLADPRQHQRGQRIIDHRLVVDRQQLLRGHQGHRVKPRAAATGKNDTLQSMILLSVASRRSRQFASDFSNGGRRISKTEPSRRRKPRVCRPRRRRRVVGSRDRVNRNEAPAARRRLHDNLARKFAPSQRIRAGKVGNTRIIRTPLHCRQPVWRC